MVNNGYRLGGEQSGHIIFSKYATDKGDGIITALKMMEVMIAKKMTLSQLAAPLQIYPQVLKNIRVYDKTAAQDDTDVKAAVDKVAEKSWQRRTNSGKRKRNRAGCKSYG